MRSKTLVVGTFLCALGYAAGAQTQAQADPEGDDEAADAATENPEYSRRSLPADTFKPSEEISEDFAVPFPVDI